jgi:hypothetical protein
MAKATITVDDLDGSTDDVEAVVIQVGYERRVIDLSAGNRAKLRSAIDPFLRVSRPVGAAATREHGHIRSWARAQGIPMGTRGRLSEAVIRAYYEAQAAGE